MKTENPKSLPRRQAGEIRNPKFKNEQGFVLVVALLALLVVTVLGILALSTSTTNVMITGNQRLREINLSGAESGLEITDPAIRYIIYNQQITNYSSIVNDPNLVTELRTGPNFDPDTPSSSPDIQLTNYGGIMTVSVDIDRMFSGPCAGSAIEFASGYEGIGMGGGGGICTYYRVNSVSRGDIGSENVIGGVYRYIAY